MDLQREKLSGTSVHPKRFDSTPILPSVTLVRPFRSSLRPNQTQRPPLELTVVGTGDRVPHPSPPLDRVEILTFEVGRDQDFSPRKAYTGT